MSSEDADRLVELAREAQRSGDLDTAGRLFADALDAIGPAPSRARALALYGDGIRAFRQGEHEQSRERNEAALEVARALGDAEAEALGLVGLGRLALREGDYARVRSLAAEAHELTRNLDAAAGVAPLHMLAAGTRLGGDYDEAARLYERSLELNRRLGDEQMVAVELHNLGHVELHRGNLEAAERLFAEHATVANLDEPYDAALTRFNEAAVSFARGDRTRAAEFLREAQSTLDDSGVVLDPDDAYEFDWLASRLV